VRRRQGTVTTVDPIALRLSVRLEEQFEHLELLGRLGFDADVEVLDTRQRAIAPAIAALLELELAMSSLVVRKRWRADGRVAMVADDTVPLPPDAQPADTDESVFSAVARLWGEPVVWEVCTPGVALVDGGLAGLFEKPVGAPLLTLEIVGIGASGRRLLHSTEYHDPDVVQYSMVRTVRPPWATR
jgi:DNA-binding GntR family transcriptional regulator